jgi:tetratricopeptide (TPR) repeat protein
MPDRAETVAEADAPGTATVGVLLAHAAALVREQKLDAADDLLARILQAAPGDPDALHYQGLLRHAQGRGDESIALIGRSLSLQPAQSGAWNNLGNLLVEIGRIDDAMRAYENSVSFASGGDEGADALSNIASLERKKGHWHAAERVSRRAIELRPDFSEAWYNLSIALMEQGRIHESVIANSRAVLLQPRNLSARSQVIRALELLGEREQAIGMYREWLAEAPGNPVVSHLLAACEGHAPARASDGYVETVFDSYAGSFDASLEKLHYRAPNWWRARCRKCMARPPRTWPWSMPAAAPDSAPRCCGPGPRTWRAATCRSACCSARSSAAATTCCTRPSSPTTSPPSPLGSTWWHRPTRCAISATCTRCWRQPRARCARKAAWCSRSRPWPGGRTTSRSKAAAATAMRQRTSRPALRPPVSAPSASSRSSRAARRGRTCRVGWPAQGFVRIDAGHGSPNFKLPDMNRLQQRYGELHE